MTGGRRHARNRRQRAALFGIARAYSALGARASELLSGTHAPGDNEAWLDQVVEYEDERAALARRVRVLEGRS